jgi:hypothetical protein
MRSGLRRSISTLAAGAAALAGTGAHAQFVPGTRPPADTAEAMDDARMIVCTLAAAGRPMGGLNIRFVGGEGYAAVDKLPDNLARFVPAAAQMKRFEYKGAGGPLWITFDPDSGRCAIYAFTDAAAAEGRLLKSLRAASQWRPKMDPGTGIDHAFEWRPEPSLRLVTEISKPHAAGEPMMVVVRPVRR